jgi:hypothetical protein
VVIAQAGFWTCVRDQFHAVDDLIEQRSLGGVADDPDQPVPTGDRERVTGGVVFDQSDEFA